MREACTNRAAALIAGLAIASAAAFAAGTPEPAGAVPASAAALEEIDVSLIGDENDGSYAWDGMKDPWEKDADALFVDSGAKRIFFVWPANNGSHDVKLRASTSTPGVTFPASSLFHNYGPDDWRWPTAGWVPVKAGTYRLYCSKHTSMKMRLIVRARVARIASRSRTLKAGVRSVSASVTANGATSANVQVARCLNSSCSRRKTVGSRTYSLRAGTNQVRVATSALAAGRYQVRSVSPDVTLASAFAVTGSSAKPRFTG